MNKGQFENIITNPSKMDYVKDLPLLKELIESFPYFSSSYLLMTKLLYREKSIYTEKYIKLTAAYLGDREILYNFLYTPEEVKSMEVILPIEVEVEIALPEKVQEFVEAKAETIESIAPEIEVEIPADIPIKEEPAPVVPFEIKPSIVPIEADFDYFAAYRPSLKVPEEPIPHAETDAKPVIPAKPEVYIIPETTPVNSSFSGWLNFLSKNPAPKKETPSLPEFENIDTHPKVSKVEIDSIITKFITSEPRIKRDTTRAKFYNPEDMAHRSVEDDGELVTETLAKIYEKQELWAKAKDIYEKLSLKIPEKSIYFAEKIRELENK